MSRVIVWFSCGAASACAAKFTLNVYPDAEVLYCDTSKYEHPDNARFLVDCEAWLGVKIKRLRSEKYSDIFDVFDKTKWLVGHGMARCSIELKRNVRIAYQRRGDIQVIGYTLDEQRRIARFERENPDTNMMWILAANGITKQMCFDMLLQARIELPAMYRMGYHNNNCVGCVKGKKGYWNKIKRDFPEAFDRMAAQERKMGVSVIPDVYLDDLRPDEGRYNETEFELECGLFCVDQDPYR